MSINSAAFAQQAKAAFLAAYGDFDQNQIIPDKVFCILHSLLCCLRPRGFPQLGRGQPKAPAKQRIFIDFK